jgi:hypothetical protein
MIEKVFNNVTFLEVLKGDNVKSLHLLSIPVDMDDLNDPRQMTMLWMYIQNFLKNNCQYPVYVFTTNSLWKTHNRFPILAFEDYNDAANMKPWVEHFTTEFFTWDELLRTELFSSKVSFDKLVASGEPFGIAATIEYPIPTYDFEERIITSQAMEIWNWLKDNCEKRIWRWDGAFRFESVDDATLFKLTWK